MDPRQSEEFRYWEQIVLQELRKKLDAQLPELRDLLYKHRLVKELRTFVQAYLRLIYEIGFKDGKKQGVCLSCTDKGFCVTRTERFASSEAGFDGYLCIKRKVTFPSARGVRRVNSSRAGMILPGSFHGRWARCFARKKRINTTGDTKPTPLTNCAAAIYNSC